MAIKTLITTSVISTVTADGTNKEGDEKSVASYVTESEQNVVVGGHTGGVNGEEVTLSPVTEQQRQQEAPLPQGRTIESEQNVVVGGHTGGVNGEEVTLSPVV